MEFQCIHFDILSGILSDICSSILSDIYSDILADIISGILSAILSDILSGIYSDSLIDILSGIYTHILNGIFSDILSGIYSGIHAGILFGIYSNILSGILSGIYSDILSGILSQTCSDIYLAVCSGPGAPQHPEIAIWRTTVETHSHDELPEGHTRSKGEEVGVGGRVGGRRKRTKKEEGVAPLLKSGGPHLAGGNHLHKSLFFMLQTAINIQKSTNHMATFHHLLHTTSSLLWFPQRPSLRLLEAAIRPDADVWPVRPGQLEKGRDSYPS
jgi:hypothetical protein